MEQEHARLDPGDVTVVTALAIEARPLEKLAPQLRVIRAGVRLAALDRRRLSTPVVISVGLAGGLTEALASGTVVIPAHVAGEDGVLMACDTAWSAELERASRRLGYPTATGDLASTTELVTLDGRALWAGRGFVAVDMETALLARLVPRVAAVRVVLDTPEREISRAWDRPARAALDMRLWRQGAWLATTAPRHCRRAAAVVAAAVAAAITPRG